MTDHILDRLIVAVGTQYVIDAEIGRGGMAVVYRATDARLHRRVAIKVLPPELAFNADVRERFLREAQTAAQLSHPHIVPIYTVDEREGLVYFVMALVDGETLGQRLLREPRPPTAQVRTILADVADALAYAHSLGVVHRDVKPDNVMLDRATGRAMVTDFGIARAAAGDSRLTVTGVAIGTPAYMSPEQALGERELDGRSDIYSLGVIGYQMLAGEPPFKAANTPAMLVKHVSEAPRPLQPRCPDAPAGLVNAISRALAKKPEDRWPDANEFRDALSGVREAAPYDAQPPRAAPPPPLSAPMPRNPWDAPRREPLAAAPVPPAVPAMPPAPPIPTWGSREDWRRWRREQRQWEKERYRRERALSRGTRSEEVDAARPIAERVARFQSRSIGAVGTVAMLAVINVFASPGHLWFLFPAAFIGIGVVTRGSRLWGDGVPIGRLFSRPTRTDLAALPHAGSAADAALTLAPAEVLAGPHGATVRRAANDRATAHELLARLDQSERDMIPDVAPTVDSLAERVGSLALTLHRLDSDVGGASVPALEERLALLRKEAGATPTPDQERRIALLDRQRASIAELTERRGILASQLESASLALQNLRFDLLKLRSSGLSGAMDEVNSATQEARAVSRDIGHAVDAVREAKRL